MQTIVNNIKQGDWKPHPISAGVEIKPILSGQEGLGFKSLYVRIPPGQELPPHTHDVTEVIYFISGVASVLVNGERVDCSEGTVIVAPANVEHGAKNNGDQDVYLLANFQG